LQEAWREWEIQQQFPALATDSLVDSRLRDAVEMAYQDPSKEDAVRKYFSEVAPGVYKAQVFDPTQIACLRDYIDKASKARIPYKRPNSMNRYGLILHPAGITGGVNLQKLDCFYQAVFNKFVHPMGSLFFPEYVSEGDDTESYAFTIRYKHGEDRSLGRHTDSSVFTLNLNLNRPEEPYGGSTLYCLDSEGARHEVSFEPGMALLHLGKTRHAALPISEGERTNLVIWIRGKLGHKLRGPYDPARQRSKEERWSTSRLWQRENAIDKEKDSEIQYGEID